MLSEIINILRNNEITPFREGIILIAGGIGSGKSVVSRILRLRGYGVFDCDLEARRLMENDPGLRMQIIGLLGPETYNQSDNSLNKPYISSRIFNNLELREKLNRLVHARVRERILEWHREGERNIYVESAIAAESGLTEIAEGIILVTAPDDVRVRRVIDRNGYSEERIRSIIRAQEAEELLLRNSGLPLLQIQN